MLILKADSNSEVNDVSSDEYIDVNSSPLYPAEEIPLSTEPVLLKSLINPSDVAQAESEAKEQHELSPELLEKQDWVKRMRLQFCRRKEFEITFRMIHDDGTINQDYFRPKLQELQQNHKNQMDQLELKKWTDSHKDKLALGISEFGIGRFREISEKFLPDWSVNELRLKAMRMIGRQNLQLYRGWKGDAAAIAKEFEFNKRVGLEFGTWKNSTLVYDDEGKVYEYLTRNR